MQEGCTKKMTTFEGHCSLQCPPLCILLYSILFYSIPFYSIIFYSCYSISSIQVGSSKISRLIMVDFQQKSQITH